MLIRDITDLTKAYVVVRDLDSVRSSYIHKNYTQPFKPNGSISNFKSDKPRVVEDTAKPPERADKSKSSSTTKCFWCQGYGHIAYACPSPFKIFMINGDPVPAPDSDTEGFTFYPESDGEDFDFEDDTIQETGIPAPDSPPLHYYQNPGQGKPYMCILRFLKRR